MIIKNKNNKKRYIYIACAALLIVAVGVGGYFAWSNHKASVASSKAEQETRENNKYVSGGVNYAPPTATDVQMNQEQEQKNTEREQLNAQANPTKADITITDASQYDSTVEVRAYVSNLYEAGGTCTATFTKSGSPAVTVSKPAMPDAKTIQCGALNAARANFPKAGDWSVSVSYKSAKVSGQSNAQVIQIK